MEDQNNPNWPGKSNYRNGTPNYQVYECQNEFVWLEKAMTGAAEDLARRFGKLHHEDAANLAEVILDVLEEAECSPLDLLRRDDTVEDAGLMHWRKSAVKAFVPKYIEVAYDYAE